jgi:hypothetical protein
VKSGGDAKRAAAAREAEKQRKLNATPARVEPGAAEAAAAAMATAAAAARQARYEGELLEYQRRMSHVSRNRREAIAKWQASTGTTMAKPETARDSRYGACVYTAGQERVQLAGCLHARVRSRLTCTVCVFRPCSIRVDVFGRLRGACESSGCVMWRRDVAGAANWSDTRVLTCEVRKAGV